MKYKTMLKDEEKLKLEEEIENINTEVTGEELESKEGTRYSVPTCLPRDGAFRIARAYCKAYGLETLDATKLWEKDETLAKTTCKVAKLVMFDIMGLVLDASNPHTSIDKAIWVFPYGDMVNLPDFILNATF